MRSIFAIFLLWISTLGAFAQDVPRSISVLGNGVVQVTPDIVRLNLGVVTEARTATDALAQNAQAMSTVFDVLTSADLPPEDIQTTQVTLNPRWDHNSRPARLVGYQATNSVRITVREIANLGKVIGAVTDAGSNNLGAISFDISDRTGATDLARERAVGDARARAELYARAAGVELGRVISISEGQMSGPAPMMMGRASMEMAADVPIAEGTMDVRANVAVVFEIAN